MTAGENDADATIKESASLSTDDDGAKTSAPKEKKVDTTRTAGHNPNKVDSPQKPKAQPKSQPSGEPSIFGSNLAEFLEFLKETWQEFRKISWPNREQVIK